jgi:hypothetical protein
VKQVYVLIYQVGAGTRMFALGKMLSLFAKTAAGFKTAVLHRRSVRFCSRFIIINIIIRTTRGVSRVPHRLFLLYRRTYLQQELHYVVYLFFFMQK